MQELSVLLFNDYETLDVFGPVEIFGRIQDLYKVSFYSLPGGLIHNQHNVSIQTKRFDEMLAQPDIVLIPGGIGTRLEIHNEPFIEVLKEISIRSNFVLTVCTGSALLAQTGLLDNRVATSNKRAFDWVASTNIMVAWNRAARWTKDGKYFTSAGVSAGMDLALEFISFQQGIELALKTAKEIEYHWIPGYREDTF